jgi:C1A family cysteine protease
MSLTSTLRVYNHIKGEPDSRDFKYTMTLRALAKQTLPVIIDFRQLYPRFIPNVFDQGGLGCSAVSACSNAVRFVLRKEKNKELNPSRLYMYWFARFVENPNNDFSDSGVTIRSILSSIHTYGLCDDSLFPYNVNKYKIKPPNKCIRSATPNTRDFKYLSVDNTNLTLIKQVLVAGLPIIFGMNVYESFESETVTRTGMVTVPRENENLLGGHVALIVGYDESKRCFIVMNSWGINWGDKGYFYLPYDYLPLTSDMWVVKFFE